MDPKYTILLVEDDLNDILQVQRAFQKAHLRNPIQLAQDGDQAVAYLKGDPPFQDRKTHPLPWMIFMDLNLPRRSGLEVLEWIRSQRAFDRTLVVVLTGSRESSDLDRALNLGANSYLTKPVAFDALLDVVKKLNIYWH